MSAPDDRSDPTWDKDDLKARVDLRDLVAEVWGQGKRSGNYVMYRARWRADDRHPSFAVYANGFKDFGGAGDSGDVYTWLEREYNLSFPDAVRWLHERIYGAGSPLPSAARREPSTAFSEPPPAAWQRAARAVLERTQVYLWSDRPDAVKARGYLRDERGLSEETIRAFRLGYNPDWMRTAYRVFDEHHGRSRRVRLSPGIVIPWYRDEILVALRIRSRVGRFADYLGIPQDTIRGEQLDKYRSYRGSKLVGMLFNGDSIEPGGDLLIVEGEFDAMLGQQELGKEIEVVTLGSATNRLTRRLRDKLLEQDRVFTALDRDHAGEEATARMTRVLGMHHVPLELPVGKDVTEYVVLHRGNLAAWFAIATMGIRFAKGDGEDAEEI